MTGRIRNVVIIISRFLLILSGTVTAMFTLLSLSTRTAPASENDMIVHLTVVFTGGTIFVLSLGLIALGVKLPDIISSESNLGFNRWQRQTLRGAGVLIGGGIITGSAYGLVTELRLGLALAFVLIVLGGITVTITLIWRGVEMTAVFIGGDNRLD